MATAEEQYWIDRAKAEQEQRNKEEKAASGPAGVATSVLSMLSSAGGAIPGLFRQPEEGALRQAQRGQGAGASLARRTASEAARRVAGNVQGADLREGLRAADRITAEGAAQASTIGAQEAQAATNSLRAGAYARRRAGQRFGAGVGMGLAGIGATLAAAKDQGPVQPEAGEGADPALASEGIQDSVTGLRGEKGGFNPSLNLESPPDTQQLGRPLPGLQATAPGVRLPGANIPPQAARPLQAPFPISAQPALQPALAAPSQPAPQQAPQPAQTAPGGPQRTQTAPSAPAPEKAAQPLLSPSGQSAEEWIREAATKAADPREEVARSMMTAEEASIAAEAAAKGYAALFSGNDQISAAAAVAQDPQNVAEYIYNEAMNYNRALKQGLEPWEAAKMLMQYGLPVDWERLGIFAGSAPGAQSESRPQ